jgi:enoyl-CoA hydratase/3-hydroxyacyl-CoA dehydrogenase
MVVPYRRWPKAATVFHDMLRLAQRLPADKAHALGVVDELADSYETLIKQAVQRVRKSAGAGVRIAEGAVDIASVADVETPVARKLPLSSEVVGIIGRAVHDAARASTLTEALEIGYAAFGATACTDAAREGIAAFQEKRKPDFKKTG